MKITLLIVSFFSIALSGCAFYGASDASPLPTPYGITPASGTAQARRDLAAGKVRLLEAGTIGVYTPGVRFTDSRFAYIPRHKLPVGCTTPNAFLWVAYAEAYNAVVVAHLQKQRRR